MLTDRLRRKRVIFFFGCLEMGGAERQGLLLAEYMMTKLDAHVEFWGFFSGRLTKMCESKGISWRVVPLPLGGTPYGLPSRFARLIRELRKAQVDILLPYTMTPNVVCGLIWKWTKAKLCVWNQRDEGVERQPLWLEWLARKKIRHFVANSKSSAGFLIQDLHVTPSLIRTIHNGVSLNEPQWSRQEWRVRLGVAPDELIVAMIANISPFKDHHTVVRAWRRVLDSFEGKARLIFAGHQLNANMTNDVRQLIADLRITQSVSFIDQIEDISGFLQAIDLLVHSSTSEGLPNAVLEAMASGKAVVATDITAIREALGDLGLYAPRGDDEVLAARILHLLRHGDERSRLGELGRTEAQRKFNPQEMCEQTVACLSEWLKE